MSKLHEDRCWNKDELADWLGVPPSYVAEKARTREWPSLKANELKFGPDERREILALLRRDAQPKATPQEAPAPRMRAARQPEPVLSLVSYGTAPLQARPPQQRRKRGSA